MARHFVGLAFDGTGAGRRERVHCLQRQAMAGTGPTLPVDVEPYGPGDSEDAAGHRVLKRAVGALGPRFADGEYATAPFLRAAGTPGLRVVARLKGNLPELVQAAQTRFSQVPPTATFEVGPDCIEVWDAGDFDPRATLRWGSVRVLRTRRRKPDTSVVRADWLTDFPPRQVGAWALYRIAKSRWEIENQGFNDSKTRYGLEHIRHHHANSVLVSWLLVALALTIERQYRLRYLPRGRHAVPTAIHDSS